MLIFFSSVRSKSSHLSYISQQKFFFQAHVTFPDYDFFAYFLERSFEIHIRQNSFDTSVLVYRMWIIIMIFFIITIFFIIMIFFIFIYFSVKNWLPVDRVNWSENFKVLRIILLIFSNNFDETNERIVALFTKRIF